ncbi:MAG: hypothetical protein V4510_03585 [bacterium]
MALDKTLTIKQRRVDIYLPTLDARGKWIAAAAKRNLSLSAFVFQAMEMELQKDALEGLERASAADLEKELTDLRLANADLRRRVEELNVLNHRAEADLAEYRAQHIVGPEPVKHLDPRLISILSEAKGRDGRFRALDVAELRRELRLNPKNPTELQALSRQLEYLEVHKVVRRSPKGWVWNDKE